MSRPGGVQSVAAATATRIALASAINFCTLYHTTPSLPLTQEIKENMGLLSGLFALLDKMKSDDERCLDKITQTFVSHIAHDQRRDLGFIVGQLSFPASKISVSGASQFFTFYAADAFKAINRHLTEPSHLIYVYAVLLHLADRQQLLDQAFFQSLNMSDEMRAIFVKCYPALQSSAAVAAPPAPPTSSAFPSSENTPLITARAPQPAKVPLPMSLGLWGDCAQTSAEGGAMLVGSVGAAPGLVAGGVLGLTLALVVGTTEEEGRKVRAGFAVGGAALTGVPSAVVGGIVGFFFTPITALIARYTRAQYEDASTVVQQMESISSSNERKQAVIDDVLKQAADRSSGYHSFASSQLLRMLRGESLHARITGSPATLDAKWAALKVYMHDESNHGKRTFNWIIDKLRTMSSESQPQQRSATSAPRP